MSVLVSPSPVPNSNPVDLASTVLDRDAELTGLLNQIIDDHTSFDGADAWLQELRDRATLWVRKSVLPTTRDEEWRFSDLSSLRKVKFEGVGTQPADISLSDIHSIPEAANRLVFVNGVYAPELSAVAGLPDGVIVSNLADLGVGDRQRVQQYLAQTEGAHEVFTALNTSGIKDVAVVWVAKNVVVETPIHLVFFTAGESATISLPRCLVVAEVGSSVTLVEEFTNRRGAEGAEEKEEKRVYFSNAVTEVWLEENAQVNHTRLELEGAEAFHIGKTAVSQARYSRYTCHAITFGGRLSRHNLEILQAGEQTETILNGLTVIGGNQLADTHSAIALNYPYGRSQQLHKCIIGVRKAAPSEHRAHAVFNGKVFVPKPAQLTDAAQLNRNLLLSPKARVDTKPQLEITADNVKCAHGATVSQLEDDEIFYLQSRGIDQDDARNLLINAFAAEVINQIPVPSLQERLTQIVNSYQSITNDS
ncbi:Fe-S cluster assembly protein SufD [Brasilonema octagenarum UFV-E1]|uniref:Fe-S cluster assembly protein SufD n=1 Tax=Brasilonema sennae CENA114 TaxID=415709 RepID=A0A856MJ60_9CYAN|nr:Fe-S cluster assembly protein SufD [Brasilonema sennae]QDL11333.1 Fe-S cluster assembly protein SufD [Brasilonema sennae CENA114]QDL17674.1 Fe-S cluster assembly protein SufD [Brasilonema octagenarum UFV-E1]